MSKRWKLLFWNTKNPNFENVKWLLNQLKRGLWDHQYWECFIEQKSSTWWSLYQCQVNMKIKKKQMANISRLFDVQVLILIFTYLSHSPSRMQLQHMPTNSFSLFLSRWSINIWWWKCRCSSNMNMTWFVCNLERNLLVSAVNKIYWSFWNVSRVRI